MRSCSSFVVTFLLMTASTALADEALPGSPTGRPPGGAPPASSQGGSVNPPPQAVAPLPADAVLVSRFLNKPVLGADGKSLGTVVDLELDPASGEITHLVLRTGGLMGMGGPVLLLGRGAVHWAPGEALRTEMTADEVQNLPVLPETDDPVRASEDASPLPPER